MGIVTRLLETIASSKEGFGVVDWTATTRIVPQVIGAAR
jgi:hypothetical protein